MQIRELLQPVVDDDNVGKYQCKTPRLPQLRAANLWLALADKRIYTTHGKNFIVLYRWTKFGRNRCSVFGSYAIYSLSV